MRARILLIDDDPTQRELTARSLSSSGHRVVCAGVGPDALQRVRDETFDLLVANAHDPVDAGLAVCKDVLALIPSLPIVLCTDARAADRAATALDGAPVELVARDAREDGPSAAITRSVARALEHYRLDREVTRLRREIDRYRGDPVILGESAAAVELREQVDRLARTDASVLVTGETGTGKELVARALHDRSPRHAGPFVPINCAAVPETLLESELFGHEKGAFTGATARRRGLFLEADGGTLFLDEIGDLPLALQPKLLRVLQEQKVRPLGGSTFIPFDCRIVAATNRDLEEEMSRRRFRRDLFYRLNVLQIFVPPLRARGHDTLVLAEAFVNRHARKRGIAFTLAQDARTRMLEYDWPGNVRELENAMESATALADTGEIRLDALPGRVVDFTGDRVSEPGTVVQALCSLGELERRHIARVLDAVGGHKGEAARVLGVDRSTLYRKIKRYKL
jgi:two-component system response regulator HydG